MITTDAPAVDCALDRESAAIEVRRSGDASVVTRAFAPSPLKALTPRNNGHAAWIYLATYGGGLVDGDALAINVDVGADASALISTQASTKVFPSPRGTSVDTRAHVSAGGLLALVPDPVVCFRGARYRQSQDIALDRGANLVLVDWMSSGRRARGERWVFDEYRSRTTVRVDGRIVFYDSVALSAADGDLAARLGRFNVLATVALVGPRFHSQATATLEKIAQGEFVRRPDRFITAAPLRDVGAIVRIAGMSIDQVGAVLRTTLSFLPPALGDDPWTRKW